MALLERWKRFLKGLFRRPSAGPGRVEDTPEMELEIERRRGIRGD